jgi:hypothetical protein
VALVQEKAPDRGSAAAVLLAVVGGTTGILVVLARANASLRSANGKLDQASTQLKSSNPPSAGWSSPGLAIAAIQSHCHAEDSLD